jgi:hypothetical protein
MGARVADRKATPSAEANLEQQKREQLYGCETAA